MDRFKAYNYIKVNSEPVDNGLALTVQGDYGKYIMSMELIALIGIGIALATLILNTQRNLRADMRAEFKAVRAEMQTQREETKTEFKAVRVDMQAQREEMKTEFKAVRADMQAQREEMKTEFKAQREAIISLLERMAHLAGLLEGLPLRS